MYGPRKSVWIDHSKPATHSETGELRQSASNPFHFSLVLGTADARTIKVYEKKDLPHEILKHCWLRRRRLERLTARDQSAFLSF